MQNKPHKQPYLEFISFFLGRHSWDLLNDVILRRLQNENDKTKNSRQKLVKECIYKALNVAQNTYLQG